MGKRMKNIEVVILTKRNIFTLTVTISKIRNSQNQQLSTLRALDKAAVGASVLNLFTTNVGGPTFSRRRLFMNTTQLWGCCMPTALSQNRDGGITSVTLLAKEYKKIYKCNLGKLNQKHGELNYFFTQFLSRR